MTRFVYPVTLEPDEDGRIVVAFPDFPFGVTDGANVAEALIQASDCLEELLAYCIADGVKIPTPSRESKGMLTVVPGPVIAAKAALCQAMREAGLSEAALAARLGINEKDVHRMMDPRDATNKISALDRALTELGKRIEITVTDRSVQRQVA